ncbi:MAG: hypothetical protein GY737_17540, partial [Desulfobacteraceae bacterium]|nr:hypothetical protein [Desulfobacteraceae bacterium]
MFLHDGPDMVTALLPDGATPVSTDIVVGSLVRVSVQVALPEGTSSNAELRFEVPAAAGVFSDWQIESLVDASAAGDLSSSCAGTFPGAASAPGVVLNGTAVVLPLCELVNSNTANNVSEPLVAVLTARVLDTGSVVQGLTLPAYAVFRSDEVGPLYRTVGVFVVKESFLEPASVTPTTLSGLDAGDTFTLTAEVSHTGASDATAYDVIVRDNGTVWYENDGGVDVMVGAPQYRLVSVTVGGMSGQASPRYTVDGEAAVVSKVDVGAIVPVAMTFELLTAVEVSTTVQPWFTLEWGSHFDTAVSRNRSVVGGEAVSSTRVAVSSPSGVLDTVTPYVPYEAPIGASVLFVGNMSVPEGTLRSSDVSVVVSKLVAGAAEMVSLYAPPVQSMDVVRVDGAGVVAGAAGAFTSSESGVGSDFSQFIGREVVSGGNTAFDLVMGVVVNGHASDANADGLTETVRFTYGGLVRESDLGGTALQRGDTFESRLVFTSDGVTGLELELISPTVRVVEPDLTDLTVSPLSVVDVDGSDEVTFTVTFGHEGVSDSPAHNVVLIDDAVSAGPPAYTVEIVRVNGVVVYNASVDGAGTLTSDGILAVLPFIDVGVPTSIEYTVSLPDDVQVGTQLSPALRLEYSSVPDLAVSRN